MSGRRLNTAIMSFIDQDESPCSDILEHHDVLANTGNATDKSVLEDAGIDRADAFVATTSDDTVNLMACWLEKKVPRTLSRRDC